MLRRLASLKRTRVCKEDTVDVYVALLSQGAQRWFVAKRVSGSRRRKGVNWKIWKIRLLEAVLPDKQYRRRLKSFMNKQ